MMGAGLLPLLSFAVPPGCTPGRAPPCANEIPENVMKTRKTADKRCCKLIFKIYSCLPAGASGRRGCYLDTKLRQRGYAKQNPAFLHPIGDVAKESSAPSLGCSVRLDRRHGDCDRCQARPWRTFAQFSAGTVSLQ